MILSHDFSLMLTTLALDQGSLRWFEAFSCKPAPRDLPSSSTQLHYIKQVLLAHLIADIETLRYRNSQLIKRAFRQVW